MMTEDLLLHLVFKRVWPYDSSTALSTEDWPLYISLALCLQDCPRHWGLTVALCTYTIIPAPVTDWLLLYPYNFSVLSELRTDCCSTYEHIFECSQHWRLTVTPYTHTILSDLSTEDWLLLCILTQCWVLSVPKTDCCSAYSHNSDCSQYWGLTVAQHTHTIQSAPSTRLTAVHCTYETLSVCRSLSMGLILVMSGNTMSVLVSESRA